LQFIAHDIALGVGAALYEGEQRGHGRGSNIRLRVFGLFYVSTQVLLLVLGEVGAVFERGPPFFEGGGVVLPVVGGFAFGPEVVVAIGGLCGGGVAAAEQQENIAGQERFLRSGRCGSEVIVLTK